MGQGLQFFPGADPGFSERGAPLQFDSIERSERSVITALGPRARLRAPGGVQGAEPPEALGFLPFNTLKRAYFGIFFVTFSEPFFVFLFCFVLFFVLFCFFKFFLKSKPILEILQHKMLNILEHTFCQHYIEKNIYQFPINVQVQVQVQVNQFISNNYLLFIISIPQFLMQELNLSKIIIDGRENCVRPTSADRGCLRGMCSLRS